MRTPRRALSVDGGGIRVIIPALVFAQLEQHTCNPFSELFDLMAATSAGGMLALGLSIGDGNGKALFMAEQLVSTLGCDYQATEAPA